jgi:hypothetical protein
MAWWSKNTIIMIFLFLGILLLIAGYFYFGYSKTEGFQSTPVNLCTTGTDDQKCDISCMPPDRLITPTTDEETAYGLYETYNLLDTRLTSPPIVAPTFLKQYESASILTPSNIDLTKPLPWDFDNISLKPSLSLFGTVSAEASQLIYTKCRNQALFGEIGNVQYDPNAGVFNYRSPLFLTTVYDKNEATAMQFGELFVNTAIGQLVSMMFESAFNMPNEITKNRVEYIKEGNFKVQAQIRDYKESLAMGDSSDVAARKVRNNALDGVYDKEWLAAGDENTPNTNRIIASNFDNIPGRDAIDKGPFKFGRRSIVKYPYLIDFSVPAKARTQLELYNKANIDEFLKVERDMFKEGISPYIGYKRYMNLYSNLSNTKRSGKITFSGWGASSRRVSDFIGYGQRVVDEAARVQNIATMEKVLEAQKKGAITQIVYTAIEIGISVALSAAGQNAFLIYLSTVMAVLQTIGDALELAAMTFIPALLSSFIDFDAVCPYNSDGTQMSSIEDYFMGNPSSGQKPFFGQYPSGVGEILGVVVYNVLQNIPTFGALIMALGKDVCFAKDATKESPFGGIKLKNNLRLPPYYYDPTLSIYNTEGRRKFQAGISGLDERLFNPLLFHYGVNANEPKNEWGGPGYPVWVDFANPIMLNKMAQFYYDASRKCASTTEDGMLSFQYITKFYGLISTTPVTCDVQCEITEIKFDPATGQKICQVIVPVPSSTLGTLHHDRRFYFYRDMGKSVINRINHIDRDNLPALQALMEDNLNIYVVTGCTNTDGTAPDCLTFNSEGESTSNPVISLGEPSGTYYSPIVDISGVFPGNVIPLESSCGRRTRFTRFNGISNPRGERKEGENDPNARIGTSAEPDNWIYGYKDKRDRYYYPSANTNALPGQTPNTLRTTKYCSVIWNKDCNYEDTNCQITTRQNSLGIVQGTIEGLIGCGFGIGQIHATRRRFQSQETKDALRANSAASRNLDAAATGVPIAGGLFQVLINAELPGQEMSISQQIRCTYDEMVKTQGTYIINGRVITSQQGFIIDQGPFINWAPGYTPQIQFCNKQTIELYDCVNSYAVRRFVNIYNAQYPNKQVKKINNITPTLNTGTKWDVNSSIAMCKYNIDTIDFDAVNFKEIPNTISTNVNVGLYLQQNKSDGTCTFVPRCMPDNSVNPPINRSSLPYSGNNYITTSIPAEFGTQAFVLNANEPLWPSTTVQTTPLFAPDHQSSLSALAAVRAGDTVTGIQAIANVTGVLTATNLPPTFQPVFDTIVATPSTIFNCASVSKQTELISTFNSAHDNIPKLLSITQALSMSTIGGTRYCLFKAKFGTVPDPENLTSTINKSNNIATAVARNLTVILNETGNFSSDDYPIHYTYTPIPKRAQWFNVPPRTQIQLQSSSFKRDGCASSEIYNDCSNNALIHQLVTEYNTQSDSKILKVLRSFTPVNGARTNNPVCDYDVERLKTITSDPNSTILDRETIRFFLRPSTTNPDPCAYELNFISTTRNSAIVNGGISLNLSEQLGLLKVPYNTGISYTKATQSQYFTAIQNYLGYDINSLVNTATTNILTQMQNIRQSLFVNTTLQGCPTKTCMDDTLIRSMLNRYNYDNYPAYPPSQNTVLSKNTIIRVTKVGTASSRQCQMELYVRNDFFADFLYDPLPQDTHFYIHNYVFNLETTLTPCKFSVTPFSRADISNNAMDISGDAYTLQCPPAGRCPSLITASSSASQSWATSNYNETMIVCNITDSTDAVLRLVTHLYNNRVVFTKLGRSYYNTIRKITKVFNAMPNILEFKITTKRVFWDSAYSIAYYTGENDDDDSFLVVTWPAGTAYEVETGYYWKNNLGSFIQAPQSGIGITSGMAKQGTNTMSTPTLEEFYFPDLTFTLTKIYRKNQDGSQTEVQLPYLANDGLTPVDPRQRKKYSCNPASCVNTDGSAV